MIGISKLYLNEIEPSDALRYGRHSAKLPSHLLQFSADKKPVVVFNCTQRCNLSCMHCYASCQHQQSNPNELTTSEAKALIDDLAQFGVPVILFSGGEPIMRPDLIELLEYAVSQKMRAVISTNGTLITPELAQKFKEIGLSYVGISLDGLPEEHNILRRSPDAFERAIQGIRNCLNAGVKVGVRLTIQKMNAHHIPQIFEIIRDEKIPRACFYHFVNCGNGADETDLLLSHQETREAVNLIIDETQKLHELGHKAEILTVDNHCDAILLYQRMCAENNPNASKVLELLKMNGGNSSGQGLGCISWDGTVYPDQFWRTRPVGNIREQKFSDLWCDTNNTFLASLKNKKANVKGRCKTCKYLEICGGNLRARADGAGDVWGDDPACYFSDEEISS